MNKLCELEERHGADWGSGYKNDHACAMFVEYIARDLKACLSSSMFFSIQVDASCDAGNIDE